MPTDSFLLLLLFFAGFHLCCTWKCEFSRVNIRVFQQRQKSCPSEGAAVCKRCGANNSGLCCSTQSVEYVKRRVWLAQRLSREFVCCQQSMSGLQSMPISFIGFSLLLCYHMHHHHRYNITPLLWLYGDVIIISSFWNISATIWSFALKSGAGIFMVLRGWTPLTQFTICGFVKCHNNYWTIGWIPWLLSMVPRRWTLKVPYCTLFLCFISCFNTYFCGLKYPPKKHLNIVWNPFNLSGALRTGHVVLLKSQWWTCLL